MWQEVSVGGEWEEGAMEVEKAFGEIKMEQWRGTWAHDCITGDEVEPVAQEEVVAGVCTKPILHMHRRKGVGVGVGGQGAEGMGWG